MPARLRQASSSWSADRPIPAWFLSRSVAAACGAVDRQDERGAREDTSQNILFSAESFGWRHTSLSRYTTICIANPAMERMMKRTLIRYKTRPESADRNAELIAGVFEELKAAKPAGVRYLSLRLDDDS